MSVSARILASVLGATGVMSAAYGAHGLRGALAKDPEVDKKVANWSTASHIQLMHAVAILALSTSPKAVGWGALPAYLWAAGSTGFAGALYGTAFLKAGTTTRRTVASVAPFGGMLMIAGWVALAIV
ncbi:hypothetical protein BJ742DRAFT_291992 [Cladochytrium replicatum]|nr:hypothetical protein BJ742DRAFT_291992 [Cladochytrium replicatum]